MYSSTLMINSILLGIGSIIFFTTSSFAQVAVGKGGIGFSDTDGINKSTIDLFVPSSPAFTALGVTPKEVIRPSSPRMLATELLNGMDANGILQNGFALDMAPYMLLFGKETQLKDYQANPEDFSALRFKARTQFSLATAKATSEGDDAIRVALGLRLTPWDDGDARLDDELIKCFQGIDVFSDPLAKELKKQIVDSRIKGEDTKDLLEKRENRLKELDKPCRVDSRARNWGRSGWTLGIAPTWISTTGKTDDLEFNSASFWTSLAYGFDSAYGLDSLKALEDNAQLIFTARYTPEEEVQHPTISGSFVEQNSFVASAQLRFTTGWLEEKGQDKSAPNLLFTLEADYINADRKGGVDDDTSFRMSVGADFKIPGIEGTYVKFSIGGKTGDKNSNDGFILGTIKKAF